MPQKTDDNKLREYGFAGAWLPWRTAMRVLSLQGKIKPEDLSTNGRELSPHITVKYGIKSDDIDELRKVLAGVSPIRAKLGSVSLFKNPEHDVLKIDVDSRDLHKVHQLINEHFENEDIWPEYKPHATIAYLKPGAGRKYLNLNQLAGDEVVFNHIIFRDRKGKTHRVQLGQEKPMNKVAFMSGYMQKSAGPLDRLWTRLIGIPNKKQLQDTALLMEQSSSKAIEDWAAPILARSYKKKPKQEFVDRIRLAFQKRKKQVPKKKETIIRR